MSTINKKIRGNQVGYDPEFEKILIIKDPTSLRYQLKKDEQLIEQGILSKATTHPYTHEEDYFCDLSHVKEEGVYQLMIEDMAGYFPFVVKKNCYEDLLLNTLRFFYLQRCGENLPEEFANEFQHRSCHDQPARIYGTNQRISVNGGWHDAGDYGRYIVAAAVTVADLLLAFEETHKISTLNLRIPESKLQIPDLLSEIRYELEWMLSMQNQNNGQVYHKVTCASFCGFIMPEEEQEELVVTEPSITATATFAATTAMAVAFYESFDKDFSERLKQASRAAYDALKDMHMPEGFKNPDGVVTGEYGDGKDIDERYWAAAALYKAFGESKYREDFETLAKKEVLHGYGWEEVGSFGNQAYLTTENFPIDENLREEIQKQMIKKADELEEKIAIEPYRVSFSESDYIWGSNMYAAENGNHLFDAYRITKNVAYLNHARSQLHYLLGKNPSGYCYVTGFGFLSPKYPHHRPSSAVGKPMEGMLVGGPDRGLNDPAAVEFLKDQSAPCCYVDDEGSYSTNEVTIYWNSALVYLLSVLI